MNIYPYQKVGAAWLASRRWALLADEMGLGKSAQAITAARSLPARRILVVCPASVRAVWEREIELWWPGHPPVQILSYDQVRLRPALTAGSWDLLILDEAHYLKSPSAARTQAILADGGVIHRSARTWFLTGTPSPNSAAEIWTMLFTCGHTRLSYEEWVRRFCSGYWAQGKFRITGTKVSATPELRQIISRSGFVLRRTRVKVLPDLPTVTLQTLTLAPGRAEAEPEEIREILARERERVADALEAGGEVDLEALAPSVPTLRRWNALRKIRPVGDLIEDELSRNEYQKIVVFACHRGLVDGLAERLSSFHPAVIHGGIPSADRGGIVDRFQSDPTCRIFVGNIIAAGVGITLTAAHHIILAEQDWVPANNDQALSRVVRIGQTRGVLVRIVELPDSLDQRISEILRRKLREISEVWS